MTVAAGNSRTQRERSDATIALLLTTAREIFGRVGYADTSLSAVVEEAGVTKGALYHHFKSKQDLFLGVYSAEGRRLSKLVSVTYRNVQDPWEAFHAGIAAFLEALLDPWVQRIMLTDAPGALGMQTIWEDLSSQGFIAQIELGLAQAVEAGVQVSRPIGSLSHIIYGAVCSASQLIAQAKDQRAAFDEVRASLRVMLDALITR